MRDRRQSPCVGPIQERAVTTSTAASWDWGAAVIRAQEPDREERRGDLCEAGCVHGRGQFDVAVPEDGGSPEAARTRAAAERVRRRVFGRMDGMDGMDPMDEMEGAGCAVGWKNERRVTELIQSSIDLTRGLPRVATARQPLGWRTRSRWDGKVGKPPWQDRCSSHGDLARISEIRGVAGRGAWGGISVGEMSSAFRAFHLAAAEDGHAPVARFCGLPSGEMTGYPDCRFLSGRAS